VESADRDAATHGWDDVRLLLNFARSLASRKLGEDDAEHIDAMLDGASNLAETSLHALSVAAKALRNADRRRTTTSLESAANLLVDAVVLLDDTDPAHPVVHRVAALIEVANVAHELGFWELGLDYCVLAADALADDRSGRWVEILEAVRRYPWDGIAAGLTVSISIGVHRGNGGDLQILLTDADRNLYHAKNQGRGRVAAG
jgi:GGDEF domain-containing protein